MNLTTTILPSDRPSSNGRVYPRDAVYNGVTLLKGKIVYGKIGHSTGLDFPIEHTALIARNIRLQGDDAVADIEIVDTPAGKQLQSLIAIRPVVFRTVGVGTVTEGKVQDDYRINYIIAISAEDDTFK